MQTNWHSVINLVDIKDTIAIDESGNTIRTKNIKPAIKAGIKSHTSNQINQNHNVNYNLANVFIIHKNIYKQEKVLIFEDKEYDIYDTYSTESEPLFIQLKTRLRVR